VAQWLARLPDEERAAPGRQLLAAVLATESGAGQVWHQLEHCAQLFRDVGHTAGELACLVQLGQLAWWSEQPEALAMAGKRVFELEAAGCADAVPLACLGRALLFDLDNDWHKALSELGRIPPGSLNEPWQGIVTWARAILLLALGLAPEAQQAAELALSHADSLYAPLAEVTRLQAMWFQGRRTEVTEALPALVRRIEDSGYGNHSALAAAECSVVHAMQGQHEVAANYLAQARAAAAAVRDAPLVDTALAVAEAAVSIAADDEATAGASWRRTPSGTR
jgi:hypothetical protein